MTLRNALYYANSKLIDTGECGVVEAVDLLREIAESASGEMLVNRPGEVRRAALLEAANELSYWPGMGAMSLLCAQLADEHWPL